MSERTDSLSAEVLQELFPGENLRERVKAFIDDVSHVGGVDQLAVRRFRDGIIRFYAIWGTGGGDHDRVTSLCSESFSDFAKYKTDFLVLHCTQEEFGQINESNHHYDSSKSGTIWERQGK